MEPVQVSSVLEKARAMLNDVIGSLYTDSVMLPYFDIAYDDLKLLTASYGIPINNMTSDSIEIVAGVTDIGGSGGPPLPRDLIEVLSISERLSGTSNLFQLMQRMQFIPLNMNPTAYFGCWSWENQVIKLPEATGDIEVKMRYLASNLGDIVNEDTVVRMNNCRNFLQYRTAGLCAEYIGENSSRGDALNAMAQASGDAMLNIAIRSQQAIPTRRRVGNLRGRNSRWGWY